MKKITFLIAIASTGIVLTSCKDEHQQQAEQKLDYYTQYIDSVSGVAEDKAAANWDAIEEKYNNAKMEVESSIATASDKMALQEKMDKASMKYEEFKTKIVSQKELANNNKGALHQSLLGPAYVNDDMQFNWVTKDNILSVYDNFVTTVQKNKDTYSREDWDEIKLVYEALDTRKNTVEKEGLSAEDNRKIAALKVKFAPMYTVNRMGAKSEENAAAKQ
ncbi:DUF6565 domain-containing protein [Flavobacterium sp. UMI-01]|uniref:DUF6565 domain-containing protein n=1 Tax=Flavobacterium sp. UMI-01 TaxID=1441053 RepID=UPI001C7D161E|nr:DUF6565 domain-containing protein [Flavobacterium sp. UMI-01]GIZ08407.1 hypothetical protein FUMI01_11340 [Flavobacterium sp. UMI-01]